MARQIRARRRSRTVNCTDPVIFAEEALNVTLAPGQKEIVLAAQRHHDVACRSGHKVGKSCAQICLALWFYHTFPDSRVIMTATTNNQIRHVLWRELRLRTMRANIQFPHVPESPHIGMRSADGTKEIIGLSTNEAERIAGISGAHMLFIIDEASGVTEDIFEAIEGNRAGGAWMVLTSNPTQPVGTFYDAFHSPGSEWYTIHLDSSKVARQQPHFPGLATTEWCDKRIRQWGEEDPRTHVRVYGNFADSAEYAVIPLSVVTRAFDMWEDMKTPESRLELGVDVARFGDDRTVICVRRGRKVLEFISRGKLHEYDVAALVVETVKQYRRAGEQKPLVKVDAVGVGLGVVSILSQKGNLFDCYGINSGERADREDEFVNLRSQLWFNLGSWLRSGGTLPKVSKLEGDLLAPTYDFDERNRRRVEKKKETKKRINRSPDFADALALAVYNPVAKLVYAAPRTVRDQTYRMGRMSRGF